MSSQHGLLQIKASAGSGKTYTLAKRYIELLLFTQGSDGLLVCRQPGYHAHILAITFTNKATGEMKERIIKELHQLATDPEASGFFRDFRSEESRFAGGVLEPERLAQVARQALAQVLFDYGTFNVSTIDSFFQGILRNFARELDRDYNYEVQIDEKFALRTAIHNFLLSLGNDCRRRAGGGYQLSDIEKWVQGHIRDRVRDSDRDWNFFKDDGELLNFARLMAQELFRQQMPATHDYLTRVDCDGCRVSDLSRVNEFKSGVVRLAKHYADRYVGFATDMSKMVVKHNVKVSAISKGYALVNSLLKPDNKIAQGLPYPPPLDALTEETLVRNSFNGGYLPPQSFIDEVLRWRDEVVTVWSIGQLLKRLPSDLGLLAMLSRIDDYLKQYSRDTNQLLLADTNDLISRVLDSGVPFLYERVGTWINHFMIDEFQDTSRKQYENFRPLLDEALSRHGDNLCMLIGDAKQSIYRFRNAEPSLFRDGISNDFSAVRHGLTTMTLDTNYRSCPAVVRFNNWLFDQMLSSPDFVGCDILERTYMPDGDKAQFLQHEFKESPTGWVTVRFDKQPDAKKSEAASAQFDPLSQLLELLLQAHGRHRWGDIGILVNTREQGKQVVECIMEHNKRADADCRIAVTSDESMLLAKSPSVKRIISLLRFIDLTQYHLPEDAERDDNGDEAEARVRAQKSYARLSEQHLYQVLGRFMEQMAQDESLPAGQVLAGCFAETRRFRTLDEAGQMAVFADELDRLLPDRRTELMTLTNIVEHLIARYMQGAGPAQETAHLLALQDCVCEFAARRSGGTVREFLNYWDTKKDKLTVPASSSSDAVNVMTIHTSKGLEFDCVIIPFADWNLKSEKTISFDRTNQIFWVSRDRLLEQGGACIFRDADKGDMPVHLIPPLVPLNKSEVRKLARRGVCLRQFVDEYDQNVLVDNMDKTYVAFTRPREELHIFAKSDSELGKALYQAIGTGIKTGATTPEPMGECAWQWGVPAMALDEPADKAHALDMPPYYVASGATRLSVRLPEDLTDKQNTGTRLHNLMSRINYARDMERAWAFCLNRGILRADDNEWPLERIRAIIEQMFTDPRTSDWFADDNRVYAERNLSAGQAEHAGTQRPDRVVRRPDGTWLVIDYKFGEQNLSSHSRQVRRYMERLKQMGKSPVKGYIWYVAHDEVVPVTLG